MTRSSSRIKNSSGVGMNGKAKTRGPKRERWIVLLLIFVTSVKFPGRVPEAVLEAQERGVEKDVMIADGNTGSRFYSRKIRSFPAQSFRLQDQQQIDQRHQKSSSSFPLLTQTCPKWAVVTTIFPPSQAVESVARLSGWCLVIVGDSKTPENYLEQAGFNESSAADQQQQQVVYFLSVDKQKMKPLAQNHFVKMIPFQSFARKNIGYLFAIRHGARIIYDFDDDNVLLSSNTSPFDDSRSSVQVRVVHSINKASDNEHGKPFNPYPLMGPSTGDDIWPRGFPLEEIHNPIRSGMGNETLIRLATINTSSIAVLQSVCNHDPDVDAIYRLTRTLPVTFQQKHNSLPLLVPPSSYAPYNAQATVHLHAAFWGLILPMTVPGRVTDIWRSYFTQRIARDLGLAVVYLPPLVTHTRNSHEYMADMAAEDDLYRKTSALLRFLDTWSSAATTLPARFEELIVTLYEHDYIGLEDVYATQEWLLALLDASYQFPELPATGTVTTEIIEILGDAPTPTAPKRWAVMMIGGARTYAMCRESFFENLAKQTDSQIDIFSYTFAGSKEKDCPFDSLGLHHLDLDSTLMHLDTNFTTHRNTSPAASYDRFVRQQGEHLDMIEEYAAKHNVKYDYIFYTRPDTIYTKPFNLTLLEQELDARRGDSGWWSPQCCRFGGLCDRLAAANFDDFARMIRSSTEWNKVAKNLVGERAFLERSQFAKLNNTFDLPDDSYSFATLRHNNAREHCHGINETNPFKNHWTDVVCYKGRGLLTKEIKTFHPGACLVQQTGTCVGER